MILIRNLRLELSDDFSELKIRAAKKIKLSPEKISDMILVKRSLDARRKNDIHYICSVAISVIGNEEFIIRKSCSTDISKYTDEAEKYASSIPVMSLSPPFSRPLIIGFGPAGMFAGLYLAKAGLKPIIIERGEEVNKRKLSVEKFRKYGILSSESNAQFGEGGAGTFSDGKLNTGTHDFRITYVLRTFYEHGASETVLYDSKPHIGTDILINIVRNIREEIISLGGELLFNTKLEKLVINDNRITGVIVSHNRDIQTIECDNLILAIGHSARDTFEMLNELSVPMERKAFSIGARIEHLQKDINRSQYGQNAESVPFAADYSLAVHLPDGKSAYTFCMCPGGEVFAAASEKGGVCTNGMSYSTRNGTNANSALLVTLLPSDFPGNDVLSGMRWQRSIEQNAYEYAGKNYFAPAQTVGDFLSGRASTGPGKVIPTYLPGVKWGDLSFVLPKKIISVMKQAIPELGKKLPGFDSPDAVLTAPECRSSSPVRILRGNDFQSEISGLFPCGEGAGYAGGITSAAVDGLRCAEALILKIQSKSDLEIL